MAGDVIVEAVPNFSEGQRLSIVNAIASAMNVPGVLFLDRSSDPDHNRSVVTIAGPPDAVLESLFRGIRAASVRINLFQQRGAHPRLGAADVVPLVPINNITLAECVTLAHQLGQRIGEDLELPVYLYEAAATRPERQSLAMVRRGEFERLQKEIHLPKRQPDYGPARLGPAGAVIVGARPFLIAYNVFLMSGDVTIARRIAHTIRERDGGLPAVRAIGLLVGGQAQVSLNLLNFRSTPVHVAVDAIRAEAIKYNVEMDRSELIGLIPRESIWDAAIYALRQPQFATPEADAIRAEAVRCGIEADPAALINAIPQDALFAVAAQYLQLPDFESSKVVEVAIERAASRHR
jgi:glutamate formiminotransferase / 5-formyltetrahydrofolate cyclo-ligase